MGPKAKPLVAIRAGDFLQIGYETVSFGRNTIAQTGSAFTVQRRLFVNDPWELIAEAILTDTMKGHVSRVI